MSINSLGNNLTPQIPKKSGTPTEGSRQSSLRSSSTENPAQKNIFLGLQTATKEHENAVATLKAENTKESAPQQAFPRLNLSVADIKNLTQKNASGELKVQENGAALFAGLGSIDAFTTNDGKTFQVQKNEAGDTVLVEVDPDTGDHDIQVEDTFQDYNPDGPTEIVDIYAGYEPSGKIQSTATNNIDAVIDQTAINIFESFGQEVNEIVEEGEATVINASLGLSRNGIYAGVLDMLIENPNQAKILGINPNAIINLETNQEGKIVIPTEIGSAIADYVDQRLDAPDSTYQQARKDYQEITKNAADQGVMVVVAMGNDHQMNPIFERDTPGGDINLLAESHSVISVAASNDNGTKDDVTDDTIADFSSRGNGKFNPTIAASGENVDTENYQGLNGTSFAAPKVAGLISQLQQENPDLTFDQVKQMLIDSAYDSSADDLAEGAGILDADKLLKENSVSDDIQGIFTDIRARDGIFGRRKHGFFQHFFNEQRQASLQQVR